MPSKAIYKVVGVGRSPEGVVTRERNFSGAPTDNRLATWAQATEKCVKLEFVTRYFPSKKGWLVLDLRHVSAHLRLPMGRFALWGNISRYRRTLPTEDAAIMLMLHKLNPPIQETFNL